ncbi:MAG: ribonuclease HII [Bacteroidales bacterium]|nr:ribonuclease HII [Bacteroidales bacterium]
MASSTKGEALLPRCLNLLAVEAGCDEAGRGCLAGPVFAAAVIIPEGFSHPWLNDSKKLTEGRRDMLRPLIERHCVWAVATASAQEIDEINILQASILAMHRALDGLSQRPEAIVVDGNRFLPYGDIPFTTIVKGDGRYANIAAASILAKTHRDEYMRALAREYPHYGWAINKGYPTKAHREAIARYGLTPHHRLTFGSCK